MKQQNYPYGFFQLGICLRLWRQRRGLTQENAASMLGVASTTWSHWETGRRMPGPNLLFLLRDLTGIPLGAMLCENAKNCARTKLFLNSEGGSSGDDIGQHSGEPATYKDLPLP